MLSIVPLALGRQKDAGAQAAKGKEAAQKEDANPPMHRRKHTKSRNGCKTCKTRRIKCDEARPHCQKCLYSGFYCDYPQDRNKDVFVNYRPLSSKEQSRSLVKRTKDASPTTLIQPIQALFANDTDFQYFNFFQTKTARNLSGFFDDEIWTRLILQACQEEEFARHAVVAIAALHKTTSTNFRGIDSKEFHHTYALQKYAKALKLMRASVGDISPESTAEYQLRRALLSSLLTTCFEFYHGSQQTAVSQILTAVRLLFSVRERTTSATNPQIGNSVIDKDLLSIFARLELGALRITRTEIFPQEDSLKGREDALAMENMPLEFSHLREARFYWDVMMRRNLSWRTSYGYVVLDDSNRTSPISSPETNNDDKEAAEDQIDLAALIGTPVPPHRLPRLAVQLASWHSAIAAWSDAFIPLFNRMRLLPRTSTDYQGATILMIGLLASGLLKAISETVEVEDVFSQHMLDLIKEVLWWEKVSKSEREEEEGGNVFMFDSCIVHHLFIIATRSLDRVVRAEAGLILKECKRREGWWDSEVVWRATEWFERVDREEGGEGERRARLVMMDEDFDLEGRTAWVSCKRVGGDKATLPRMTLSW